MRRALVPAIFVLSACGGSAAAAQAPAPVQMPVDHAWEYSVAGAAQEAPSTTPSIQVSGTGSVSITPDMARIAFAVETRAATADAAADENASRMEAVIQALRAAGLPGLELETYGYRLNPEYRFEDNDRTRRIDGYTVVNNVRATVDDVDAAGRVIDVAIRAGANRVASLSFEASDTRQARLDALAEAVSAAREEAEAIAAALGRQLGPVIEVYGGSQVPGPRPYEMAMMRTADASNTPVEVGDQDVIANVTVKFAIGAPR